VFRPVKIAHYVRFMQARGYAPHETLQRTWIDATRLSDPSYLLDRTQCEAVVANMVRLTGNQAIGFDVALSAQLDEFGIIAHAMRTSRTLREAVAYWVQFSNLVGMVIHIAIVERARGKWTVVFTAEEPAGITFRFCTEEMMLVGIRFGSALTGLKLEPEAVQLSYPAPAHARIYSRYLGCPAVSFNAPVCALTIGSPSLDTPLPGHDPELNEIYRRRCREVLRQIGGEDPISARLRALFLRDPAEMPDLPLAAQMLGLSARTLRRRLQHEGTHYQRLLNDFRRDLCLDHLASGTMSNKEIAGLLGFDDVNSLYRAFRSWTGRTLGDWRGVHRTNATSPLTVSSRRRIASS
jgi:AraC-like DNA-binding protein